MFIVFISVAVNYGKHVIITYDSQSSHKKGHKLLVDTSHDVDLIKIFAWYCFWTLLVSYETTEAILRFSYFR